MQFVLIFVSIMYLILNVFEHAFNSDKFLLGTVTTMTVTFTISKLLYMAK